MKLGVKKLRKYLIALGMHKETTNNERQECIVYSRVVGWITPTKNWNPGKKSEFGDRVVYEVK